jgi:acetyl/propionyl-CoA carboxylase alpha subunit
MGTRTVILRAGHKEYRVTLESDGQVSVDGVRVQATTLSPGEMRVGDATRAWVCAIGDIRWVFHRGEVFELEVVPEGRRRRVTPAAGSLSAPMPATVVRVDVTPGALVRRGDTLVILEAMKMELPIRASTDGTVTAVHCKAGDLVQPGIALIDIEQT